MFSKYLIIKGFARIKKLRVPPFLRVTPWPFFKTMIRHNTIKCCAGRYYPAVFFEVVQWGKYGLGMARLYLKRVNVLDHNIEERKWLVARGNVLVLGFRCFPAEMVAKFESKIVDHKAGAG